MSWKDVNNEMQRMEQIVNEMEEEEQLQQPPEQEEGQEQVLQEVLGAGAEEEEGYEMEDEEDEQNRALIENVDGDDAESQLSVLDGDELREEQVEAQIHQEAEEAQRVFEAVFQPVEEIDDEEEALLPSPPQSVPEEGQGGYGPQVENDDPALPPPEPSQVAQTGQTAQPTAGDEEVAMSSSQATEASCSLTDTTPAIAGSSAEPPQQPPCPAQPQRDSSTTSSSSRSALPPLEPPPSTSVPDLTRSEVSYQRFPSPRPPNLVLGSGESVSQPPPPPSLQHQNLERKGSASGSGILRLDGSYRSGHRRSSAEPTSPSPSADRLSVTFAVEQTTGGSEAAALVTALEKTADYHHQRSSPGRSSITIVEPEEIRAKTRAKKEIMDEVVDQRAKKKTTVAEQRVSLANGDAPAVGPASAAGTTTVMSTESVEDEYTDSIMEITRTRSRTGLTTTSRRRSSNVSSSRRLSVQSFLRGRRTSSGLNSSSGGDAESLLTRSTITDKAAAAAAEAETLKLHNEVIEQTKYQLWPLDKKLRVIKTAKDYVRRHESELQEKYAQSRTFSSYVQQFQLLMIRFLQLAWRFIRELLSEITPWQQRIKDIESHFGSVVSSYFVFLRWLFWMNFAITLVLVILVIVPEVFAAEWSNTGARKKMLPVEKLYAFNLKVMWDFEGILRYSPIFYGFFSNKPQTKAGYPIPLAYFCSGMLVYVFSFATILKKMAQNSKQSKLSEKGDECTFTWKVFASWDYGIANVETAHNKVASIIMGFREALVEEMEKEKMAEKSWKMIAKRVFANFLVLLMLIGSAYAVVKVVERSTAEEAENSWYRQNEITIVMSMISMAVPNFFDLVGLLEQYHPRKAMRWMLARIMALNLLSLYTLIFALFAKTQGMIDALNTMEAMNKAGTNYGLETLTTPPPIEKNCFKVPIPCELLSREEPSLPPVLSLYFEFDNDYDGGLPNNGTLDNDTTTIPFFYNLQPSQNQTSRDAENTTSLATTDDVTLEEQGTEVEINEESLIQLWLRNLTSRHPEDDCKSCLDRCGHSCFDVCHVLRDCSDDQEAGYRSNTNLTTLIMFFRGLLNSTNLADVSSPDEFQDCYECANSFGDQDLPREKDQVRKEDHVDSEVETFAKDPGSDDSDRHCTKQICRRRFFGKIRPVQIQPPKETCATAANKYENDLREKLKLRKLCWETMFGQELVKLTVMDTVFTLMTTFVGDFLRAVFLRVMNPCWFWDMEKKFPKYPDFKVAENILHLVNNQGMIWMGLFMAPALPAINLIKLAIIMYVRSWAVMTTNVPHETVFRASRSNNFYFILLLMMLFLCTLPVAYSIVWLKPSWHCGPFSGHRLMYHVLTEKIFQVLPKKLHPVIDYFTSPGVVIPVFVLLVLIIYYLVSLTGLLRESNEDLKNQLHHERTEERRKLLQGKQGGAVTGNISERWKKLLGSAMSSTRASSDYRAQSDITTRPEAIDEEGGYSERAIDVPGEENEIARKEAAAAATLSRVLKARVAARRKAKADALKAEGKTENGARNGFSSTSAGVQNSLASESATTGAPTASVSRPATDMGSMCNRFPMETESSSLSKAEDDEEDEEDTATFDEEGNRKRPPKIWISKSASMEHDLD